MDHDNLLVKLESFQERDPGWGLIEILQREINFNNCIPIGVVFSTFVEMPKFDQNYKVFKIIISITYSGLL